MVFVLLFSLCWAEENVRLFFHKTAAENASEGRKHVVRAGEWLYKILEDVGFSREQFPQVIPKVRAMNPHVADFDHLRAGQVLYLPAPPKSPQLFPRKRSSSTAFAPRTMLRKEYVVQHGETLLQILRRETGASDAEIYGRLLDLVRQFNPHIQNFDMLRAGDRLELPAEVGWKDSDATTASPASPGELSPGKTPLGGGDNAIQGDDPARSNTRGPDTGVVTPKGAEVFANEVPQSTIEASEGGPAARPAASGASVHFLKHTQTRTHELLQRLGFRFLPGEEALFPLEDGSWFAIDLRETPALSTPWAQRILLVDAPKPASWIKSAQAAGFVPIMVPADWQLRPVFHALAEAFPQRLRLWPAGRNLVLPRQGMSINLKADLLAVLSSGQTMAVWNQNGQPPLPQGVRELLAAVDITLLETDARGAPFAPPSLPAVAMLLPTADAAWLHKQLDARFPEIRPLTSPGQMLAFLRHEKHLISKYISLSWVRGANELAIQIPVWFIDGQPPIALLEDPLPATVALLTQNGYQCARIEER